MYTLIQTCRLNPDLPPQPSPVASTQTCRLNNVDPHAWLADVIARMPDHPQTRIEELLPWNWIPTGQTIKIKQAA